MEESPMGIVWDVDSQDAVEFQAPSPPDCGFHSIAPTLPDYTDLLRAGVDAWEPNLGPTAQPVLPPPEPRLVGVFVS